MSTKITVKMEKTSNSILFQVSSEKPLIREKTVKRPALTALYRESKILLDPHFPRKTTTNQFFEIKVFHIRSAADPFFLWREKLSFSGFCLSS